VPDQYGGAPDVSSRITIQIAYTPKPIVKPVDFDAKCHGNYTREYFVARMTLASMLALAQDNRQ
jgi:hypothetical protein